MIAHKEKTAVLRELFEPGDDRPDAAVETQERRRGIACKTAERVLLLQRLVHRNGAGNQAEEENIENMQQKKTEQRKQKGSPQAQMEHQERQGKETQQGDGQKNQKQSHNNHPIISLMSDSRSDHPAGDGRHRDRDARHCSGRQSGQPPTAAETPA